MTRRPVVHHIHPVHGAGRRVQRDGGGLGLTKVRHMHPAAPKRLDHNTVQCGNHGSRCHGVRQLSVKSHTKIRNRVPTSTVRARISTTELVHKHPRRPRTLASCQLRRQGPALLRRHPARGAPRRRGLPGPNRDHTVCRPIGTQSASPQGACAWRLHKANGRRKTPPNARPLRHEDPGVLVQVQAASPSAEDGRGLRPNPRCTSCPLPAPPAGPRPGSRHGTRADRSASA